MCVSDRICIVFYSLILVFLLCKFEGYKETVTGVSEKLVHIENLVGAHV